MSGESVLLRVGLGGLTGSREQRNGAMAPRRVSRGGSPLPPVIVKMDGGRATVQNADEVAAVRAKLLSWSTTLTDTVGRAFTTDGIPGVECVLRDAVIDVLTELADPARITKPGSARSESKQSSSVVGDAADGVEWGGAADVEFTPAKAK